MYFQEEQQFILAWEICKLSSLQMIRFVPGKGV